MSHNPQGGAAVAAEGLEPRWLLATARFVVLGDYGTATQSEADVAALVKSWQPEFIVTVGDNNYPLGEAWTIDTNVGQFYQEFIGDYRGAYGPGAGAGPAANRFFPSMGNHDWYSNAGAAYLDYFTIPASSSGNERYYDFVRGPIHFFALSSDGDEPHGNSPTSLQGRWLQNALAASTSRWNIVYFHHSPYSSGPHGSEPDMQWPFQAWGADAVFTGHDHLYERIMPGGEPGLPYVVNGLGGHSLYIFEFLTVANSRLRYNANFGAMLVEATDNCVTCRFITRSGELIDAFVMTDATSAPAAPSGVTATAAGPGQVVVEWNDNSGASENAFRIERSDDGGASYDLLARTGSDITRYRDLSAIPGVSYRYRVRAVNRVGDSGWVVAPAVATPAAPSVLIAAGAHWRYHNQGTDLGTGWRELGFNHTSWPSGEAEFGYGDGDEVTQIASGSPQRVTTYFRKTITVTNPALIGGLELGLRRDDGAVVYLNGAEVFRSNMPGGEIAYDTRPPIEIDDGTVYRTSVNPALLRVGENVLAVEVHQAADDGGEDMSFDLQLLNVGMGGLAPSNLSVAAANDGQVDLAWGDPFFNEAGFRIERSSNGVNFTQIGTAPANVTAYEDLTATANTLYYYRVRAFGAGTNPPESRDSAIMSLTTPAGPTVDIQDVAPDPRNAAVEAIIIDFVEPVVGFDLSDLVLRRDGGANLLPGGASLNSEDDATWVLEGLAALTAAEGTYELTLAGAPGGPAGSGIADLQGDGLVAGAVESFRVDTTRPIASAAGAGFDPLQGPHRLTVAFSEAVLASLASDDLLLTNLTTGQQISPSDLSLGYGVGSNIATFTYTGPGGGHLGGILPDGNYRATLAASDVVDAAGNSLASDWVYDFYVLAGDANRDRAVDVLDLGVLSTHYGLAGVGFDDADFNYDGQVDVADLGVLGTNYGKRLDGPEAG